MYSSALTHSADSLSSLIIQKLMHLKLDCYDTAAAR